MISGSDEPARPLSFLAAAAWTFLLGFLFQLTLSITRGVQSGTYSDIVTIATCHVLATSVVLFTILRVHEPETSIRHVLALRRAPVITIVLGTMVGLGLGVAAMWLDGLLASRFPASPAELEAFEYAFAAPNAAKKAVLMLCVAVVMPICDELFFRGALFTPLKRGRQAEHVILATAAYDMLLGATGHNMVSMLATALAMSWIRAATGSVFPSLGARIAFFGVQVAALRLVAREVSVTAPVAAGAIALAMASLAGIALVGKRSARILDARLEDG